MSNISEKQYDQLKPWFKLKATEFNQLGYDNIQVDDIYRYFKEFSWKHTVPPHYYQQIRDIMKTTVNHYFDFVALEAQVYKVSSLDEINFDDIL